MRYVIHHGDQSGRQISAVPDHLTMSEFRSNPDWCQFAVGTITRGGTHRGQAYRVEWCDSTRSTHKTLQDVRDECQRRTITPGDRYHPPAVHGLYCYDDQGRFECCCPLRRDADQQRTEQISRAEAEQMISDYAVEATAQVLTAISSPPPVFVVGQTYTVDSVRQLAEEFGGAMIGFPDDE